MLNRVKNSHLLIAGLVCFILAYIYFFPPQAILKERILREEGYSIVNQNQTVSAEFTFDPKWIPTNAGQHYDPHFVFFDRLNTKILVSDVYKTESGDIDVTIDTSSKYFRNGGEFVSTIIIHDINGSLSYSAIYYKPIFSDPITGNLLQINYGIGAGPNEILTVVISKNDAEEYLSKPVRINVNNLNLVTYKKN